MQQIYTPQIKPRRRGWANAYVRNAGFHVPHGISVEAIEALNNRLSQHCIGYKFEAGEIIRIDNEVLYSSITKEVIVFLSNPDYHNIDAEYMQAHRHFRSGDYKDCISNAAKAFESTLKVVCDKKGYRYDQTMTASPLVQVLIDNQFLPSYMQKTLAGIRSILDGGVSVVRNKTAGHGAGVQVIGVDENLATFALNSAGQILNSCYLNWKNSSVVFYRRTDRLIKWKFLN